MPWWSSHTVNACYWKSIIRVCTHYLWINNVYSLSTVMGIVSGFSRNYTSTVVYIAEKCEFYQKVEELSNQSLKIGE